MNCLHGWNGGVSISDVLNLGATDEVTVRVQNFDAAHPTRDLTELSVALDSV